MPLFHHFEAMTPDKRPQRPCIYVPVGESGEIVDSKGYQLVRGDVTDDWRDSRFAASAPIHAEQPIEIPPSAAEAFLRDIKAFFAAGAPALEPTQSPRSDRTRSSSTIQGS